MENSQSESNFSDDFIEHLKESSVTFTSSYAENAETLALLSELADDLDLSSYEAFQRSITPVESIVILLFNEVAKQLVVDVISEKLKKLVATLLEIREKRKVGQQKFDVMFTVRSISADDVTEVNLHDTDISEENIVAFLTEGLNKANRIADRFRADGGENVIVSLQCSNGKVTVSRVLGRNVGYIDFADYLDRE